MTRKPDAKAFFFYARVIMLVACWLLSWPASGDESGPVPVIDVLFVYTPAAMLDSREVPPAQNLVEEANRILLNSKAQARLRLAHAAKVAYVEPPVDSGDQLQLTLDRLTNPQDGYLDEVHALREQYSADAVVLLERGLSGSDGFLAPLRPDAAHAFGVLTSTTGYAFTRLIGRLLGCETHRGPAEEVGRIVGEGAFEDSHAYVITNWQSYVTMMGSRRNLAPFFSSPEVSCFGSPLGIAGAADNVRTVNLVAPEFATFRGADNFVSPPQVQWQTPAAGAQLLPGSEVSLQVSATAAVGDIQKIEFSQARFYHELDAGVLLTNVSPEPADRFRRALTNAEPGWYWIAARATDHEGVSGQGVIEFRVRAPNDDFTTRLPLRAESDRRGGDLRGMSLEPDEPLADSSVQASAWYTWTAPEKGFLQARIASAIWTGYQPLIRAYYGGALTELIPSGANPNRGSPLHLHVDQGVTVQLSLGCSRAVAGPADLVTDFLPLLSNDSFETRVPVAGESALIAGHNVGAQPATNAVWQSPSGPTVWWAWTPSVSGLAQIQTSNYVGSQTITVFRGGQPATLSMVSELAPSSTRSVSKAFPVRAGEPLPVAVTALSSNTTGNFAFRLAVLPGAPNNTFSNRLSRTGSPWVEPLLFPAESAPGAPAGVGPYATWWEWTAPQSGVVVAAISGWAPPKIAVFTGDTLASLQPVQTLQSGWGLAAFPVLEGARYHLALNWDGVPHNLGAGFALALRLGFAATNDNFAQRVALSGTAVDLNLSNAYGTSEPGEPNSPLASLWYSWTAPSRGRVSLSATGQVGIAVFRGSVLSQLTNALAQSSPASQPTFVTEPGVEYQIAVWVADLDKLPISAQVSLDFQPSPANDEFATGQWLSQSQYTIAADLGAATANPSDPVIPGNSPKARTLWWRWNVPADGVVSLTTLSSYLGVYRGENLATLAPLLYCYGLTPTPKLLGVKAGDVLELMLAGDGYYPASFKLKLLPPWGNDAFAGRTTLGAIDGNPLMLRELSGTTHGATPEIGEPLSRPQGQSRWWTWSTPVSGIAKIRVSPSTGQAYLEQFCGTQLSTLRSVAWQAAPYPTLRFHADAGMEYPLAVDAFGNQCDYSISVELIPDAPVLGNDSFRSALDLNGPTAKVQGTHRAATAEPYEPAHGGMGPMRSLWFRWSAPRTGRVRLWAKPISRDAAVPIQSYPAGTLSQPHQPGLGVYVGETLESLLAQACHNIPSTNAYEAVVEFDAVAGQNYALALEGGAPSDADVGEYELQLVQLPSNDDFANRIPLQGSVALLSGAVFGATRATNEWIAEWPSSGAATSLMNVWWEWTVPADLRVTLRNMNPNEHFWAVWRSGINRQWPAQYSVMDRYFGWEDTRRDFLVRAGEVYYIAVYATAASTIPVDMELEGVPAPANDDFATPAVLAGERVSVSARADNASRQLYEPPHGLGTVGISGGRVTNAPSLWWSWTAPRSGLFALTTEAQGALRPQLPDRWDQVARADCFVYQGEQLTSLLKVAGTAPDTSNPPSGIKRVIFNAVAGATYQFAVCPILMEKRVWDTAKYSVNLSLDPVAENSSADTALPLEGSSPSFSGNLRSAVNGLWWRWTAPQTGTFAFAQRLGGGGLDRQLLFKVYRRDPTSGNLVSLTSNTAQAGETYWFQVSVQLLDGWETPPTWNGQDLPFDAALGLTRQATNTDSFDQREQLGGEVAALVGDNTAATREPGEPLHGGALGCGSLWWQWTAPRSGLWTMASRTPWRPLLLDVYRGSTLATLERVPTERNPLRREVLFQVQAGETYFLVVDNPTYTTGAFQVDLLQYLAPTNDTFAEGTRLDSPAPVWKARNVGASAQAGEPNHAGCAPAASVWWTWTAPNSSAVVLSASAGDSTTCWGPPRLSVYRGNSLSTLTRVGDNRSGGELVSNLTFRAEAGVSYSLALDTSSQEAGTFLLALSPTNAPFNDDFGRRLPLVGSQAQDVAFNFAATLESGEPFPAESPVGATLWWSWRAPGSGQVLIDTSGSDFDTGVAVYQGNSLAGLNLVGHSDDIGALPDRTFNFGSRLAFDAKSGTIYSIQVGSVTGARGRVTLTLQGPSAPAAQLLGAEVLDGGALVQLRLSGTPGQTVWVQASSDLLHWEWVGSLQFVAASAVWNEPINPVATARFYRLVSPP